LSISEFVGFWSGFRALLLAVFGVVVPVFVEYRSKTTALSGGEFDGFVGIPERFHVDTDDNKVFAETISARLVTAMFQLPVIRILHLTSVQRHRGV